MTRPDSTAHLALLLVLVSTIAPAMLAAGPERHRPLPTEAPVIDRAAGRYDVQIDPSIAGAAFRAIGILEAGMGTSMRDPFSNRTLVITTMPGGYAMGTTAQALGVAMRSSLNGHVHTCEVRVTEALDEQAQVEVLLHELLHCIGLGHADSGIMGGGYHDGQEPSAREYAAARCILTGDRCEVLRRPLPTPADAW